MARDGGALLFESDQRDVSRARHFCADGSVAERDVADSELWRRDRGLRPVCDSEAEGQRKYDQVPGAARRSLWKFGDESAARGCARAVYAGGEVYDSRGDGSGA